MSEVTPSNPGQAGSKEVLHDGMGDAGHSEQANRAGDHNSKEEKEEK